MEIINARKVWTVVTIICILTVIGTFLSVNSYLSVFNGKISDSQAMWGTFGDFIGGVVGTLFNLIAVIFSFLGIYITLRIATRIHENEQKSQSAQVSREIELLKKQNKPFPYIDAEKFTEKITISLCNYGLGPLIVKDWHLVYNGEKHNHFAEILVKEIPKIPPFDSLRVFTNTAPTHILPPNSEKLFFSVELKGEANEDFTKIKETCKKFLSKSSIHVNYEDIFENKYSFEFDFKFFK